MGKTKNPPPSRKRVLNAAPILAYAVKLLAPGERNDSDNTTVVALSFAAVCKLIWFRTLNE